MDLPFGHEISLPLTLTLICDNKILVPNQCLIGRSIWNLFQEGSFNLIYLWKQ